MRVLGSFWADEQNDENDENQPPNARSDYGARYMDVLAIRQILMLLDTGTDAMMFSYVVMIVLPFPY